MVYRFGAYILNTETGELLRAGIPMALQRKVFQVLTYLVQQRHRLVTRQELLDTLWPEEFVTDASLTRCIVQLRKALDDHRKVSKYIKTVHGQGYRFIATVIELASLPSEMGSTPLPSPLSSSERSPPVPGEAVSPSALLVQELEVSHPERAAPQNAKTYDPSVLSSTIMSIPVGEYKSVTALCGALTHTLALTEKLGIKGLQSLLSTVATLIRTLVERYKGMVYLCTSEEFVILFGVPLAQEDHARRAVLTALDLQQHLQEGISGASFPLQICMGIHTGVVVVGPSERGEEIPTSLSSTMVGEAIPLAKQLQYRATPGTILLSENTARLLREMFQMEMVGSLPVDTRSSLTVYRITGTNPEDTTWVGHGKRFRTRFIGREGELTLLYQRLVQVQQGHGQVIIILGEPGIGKSRLLAELQQGVKRQDVMYLEGHCQSYGYATPYLPILDLVRQLLGISRLDPVERIRQKLSEGLQHLEMTPAEWAPSLLYLLEVSEERGQLATLSPQALKRRIFETLHQLFLQQSRHHPLLLAIENGHWIDATSAEYLTELVERLIDSSLFLIVTTRPGYRVPWLDKSYVTQIALQPLSPLESRRVIQAALGRTRPSTPLIQRIVDKADGNPLFLEELAQTVLEHGEEWETLPIPETIQAVLAARIDQLPTETKRLLQVAAILGERVRFSLLQAVTGLAVETLHQELAHLQAKEFLYKTHLVPEHIYTFKHILTQEVAYQSLLQHTRRQYHQRIVQVLAEQFPEIQETQPELIAYHCTEAGLKEQAITYWGQAGQRAVERSAYVEAMTHFTKGMNILKTLPDTSEYRKQELTLLIALGPVVSAVKGQISPEVEQIYRRAQVLCQQEEPLLFPVLYGLWRFYGGRGEQATARALAEELLHMAHRLRNAGLQVVSRYAMGATLYRIGALAESLAHLEQGLSFYNPLQHRPLAKQYSVDPGVGCLCFAAHAQWLLGYPDQALQMSEEALRLVQQPPHAFSLATVLHFAAVLHHFRREPQAVQAYAERAMAHASAQAFLYWLAQATMLRGWAQAMQGDTEEGLAQIQRGLTIYQTPEDALSKPYPLSLLAEVYELRGQIDQGLDVLEQALTLVEQGGVCWWQAELFRLKGELLLKRGINSERQRMEENRQWTINRDQHTSRLPPPTKTISEAEGCFHKALTLAHRQQAKSLEWRAAMSLSRLWQQQGKQKAARQLLGAIYEWFTEGLDTADLHEARALLDVLSSPRSSSL